MIDIFENVEVRGEYDEIREILEIMSLLIDENNFTVGVIATNDEHVIKIIAFLTEGPITKFDVTVSDQTRTGMLGEAVKWACEGLNNGSS